MVSDQQIDSLVDEITRRVTARMTAAESGASTAGRSDGGLNHIKSSVASVVGEELQNTEIAGLIDHTL